MLYNLKWIRYEKRHLLKVLADSVFKTDKITYGPNLRPDNDFYDLFLVPSDTLNENNRKVLGVFVDDKLVMALGARKMDSQPAWVLSFVLSSFKDSKFHSVFKDSIKYLCNYFESKKYNEFYVVHPAEKEKVYRYMLRFMRDKYWTFCDIEIPKHTKPEHSLFWNLMGYQLYPYNIKIRRYILKR